MTTTYTPNYTHRVVWEPGRGYRAQHFVLGSGWLEVGSPDHASHVEARLDCVLDNRQLAQNGSCAALEIDPIVRSPADDLQTTCKLRQVYGHSYFGSGGAYGRIRCDDNCMPVGERDNGFVRSAEGVTVLDQGKPARFSARGGDSIGNGRTWSEAATWVPGTGWVADA